MKKTERNQNMTNQRVRNDETVNTSSLPMDRSGQQERYSDVNLNKTPKKGEKQRYDDNTGTVENGIG